MMMTSIDEENPFPFIPTLPRPSCCSATEKFKADAATRTVSCAGFRGSECVLRACPSMRVPLTGWRPCERLVLPERSLCDNH